MKAIGIFRGSYIDLGEVAMPTPEFRLAINEPLSAYGLSDKPQPESSLAKLNFKLIDVGTFFCIYMFRGLV